MSMVADESVAQVAPATDTANSPLHPFTPAGPLVDHPITEDDLDRALAHLLAHYPDNDQMQRSAKKARAAVKRTADEDPAEPQWVIEDAGVFQVLGSSGYYTVTDSECYKRGVRVAKKKGDGHTRSYCKGFIHSGLCYHQVARELVRLAQVLRYGAETVSADEYYTHIAEAGDERAIMFASAAQAVAAIGDVMAHGDGHVLTLDWNEAGSRLTLRFGTASTWIEGVGGGMAALNIDPQQMLEHLVPLRQLDQEAEFALRFGTAPVTTLIMPRMTINVRGAHLV